MKKAEFTMLAVIIATIAVLIIGITIYKQIDEKAQQIGGQAGCNLGIVLSTLVKTGTGSLTELAPECKANIVVVNNELIKEKSKDAEKRINFYYDNKLESQSYYTLTSGKPTEASKNEWAMNKIMADELKSCSDKILHGKLDFTQAEAVTGKTTCIVCSVLLFSQDLPNSLKYNTKGNITSLYNYLFDETTGTKSYYAHIFDGVIKPYDPLILQYNTARSLSIVYTERKASWYYRNLIESKASWYLRGGPITWVMGIRDAMREEAPEEKQERSEDKASKKFLGIQSYELLTKEINEGGLGCQLLIA